MPGKHIRQQNATNFQPGGTNRQSNPNNGRPAAEALNATRSADDTGFDRLPIDQIPTYEDRVDPSPSQAPTQVGAVQKRVYRGKVTEPPKPRRSIAPVVVLVCLVVICLVGFGTWLLLSSSGSTDVVNTNVSQESSASNQAQQVATNTQDQADDATVQGSTATDILATLSTLQHNGQDVSLPTEGAEVDVLGGRVLVAFRSDDTAENVISQMASASVALADALSQSAVADSSTATDGVSQVPAASTPGAIASSANGTEFTGVEVVALSDAGYVISAITLSSGSGLETASEAEILSGSDSYAIQGPAYVYTDLRQQGVAQSKGDAPTLLTGEEITINMTASQTTTSTSSTSNTSNTSSSQSSTSNTSSSSTSTSTGTSSRTYSTGTSSRGTSSYSYSGTGYYGGTSYYDSSDDSSYSSGSSSDSSSYDSSSSTSTDSGSSTGTDSGSTSGSSTGADSGSTSSDSADGGTSAE